MAALKKKDTVKEIAATGMPHLIQPMLAHLVDVPFDRQGWIFEIKWDGFRAIAEIHDGKVALYSRNEKSFQDKFPDVFKSLGHLKGNMILDGEGLLVGEKIADLPGQV